VTALTVRTPLRLKSSAECVRFERESFGAVQQMLVFLPLAEQEAAWDEIEHELGAFKNESGFSTDTELVVGVGIR